METIKRMPICRILNEQQRKWLDSGCCPICGLQKKEWKRRTDWTCCSLECSKKYQECFRVWQYWKRKVFIRDNYTCVKCCFKSRKEDLIDKRDNLYQKENFGIYETLEEKNGYIKVLIGDESKLIADHIVPIAIGGEEYDLDNVQTLCKECNKIKTKEDLKKIALYRKRNKEQEFLCHQKKTK
jgi:5-methylcytosine-specific restriction endonuclease McrA